MIGSHATPGWWLSTDPAAVDETPYAVGSDQHHGGQRNYRAQEKITWLDGQIAGKDYVCGERFSLADIMLFCFLEFGGQVGQPLNESNANIMSLYQRISNRASSAA